MLENIDWGLVAASLSAIGTIAAAYAAYKSKNTADRALNIQNRLYVYDMLKSCAEKANSYAGEKKSYDWNFHDAANIVRSLKLAMDRIEEYDNSKNKEEIKSFKRYLLGMLNIELFSELSGSDTPDAFFKGSVKDQLGIDVWNDWLNVQSFFFK